MSIIKTNTQNFEKDVLKSDKPVVLDFSAEWCGPCKALEPTLTQIATEREDVKIVKVDVDESKEIAAKYNVRSMPTLMIFNEGKVVSTFSGSRSKSNLNTWINEHKGNTEKKDFTAKTDLLKKVREDKTFQKGNKTSYKVFNRLRATIIPGGIIGGGIALGLAATGPVGWVLAGGAVLTGAHTLYKQSQMISGLSKVRDLINKGDEESLKDRVFSGLQKFNPYVFFGRTTVKSAVTAAAGVTLIGATSGLGLALLGGAMAAYGVLGTVASTAGLIGSYFGIKAIDKKLDEIDQKREDKAFTNAKNVTPGKNAEGPAKALAGLPAPAEEFNPAANQNAPEAKQEKPATAKKPAAKKPAQK